jgi:hypothetical protein
MVEAGTYYVVRPFVDKGYVMGLVLTVQWQKFLTKFLEAAPSLGRGKVLLTQKAALRDCSACFAEAEKDLLGWYLRR